MQAVGKKSCIEKLLFDEVEELVACFLAVEGSGEVGCGCQRAVFLNSTHLHAEVSGFDNDNDAKRLESVLYAVFDLCGHAFLNLQTAGEDINDTRYLAQSGYLAVGDIGYMSFAEEGQEMVLT